MPEKKPACPSHIMSTNDPNKQVGVAWLECRRKDCLLMKDPRSVVEVPYSNPESWEEARLRAAAAVELFRNRNCPLIAQRT